MLDLRQTAGVLLASGLLLYWFAAGLLAVAFSRHGGST